MTRYYDDWFDLVNALFDQDVFPKHLATEADNNRKREKPEKVVKQKAKEPSYCKDIYNSIENIRVVKDKNTQKPIGIIMKFVDGNTTKAICMPEDRDKFNYETGIDICLLKWLMGGSSMYNNTIKKILKGIEE